MYGFLAVLSLFMMSADGDGFMVWFLWELFWLIIFLFSASRMNSGGEK